ncbi:uncharacterized protein LOC113852721 [Abrus precatorius]|uniref:Uncharacterized protein LOC113852721 n=1 Tax=Abrus precatorius TaxID=3816 RepID=A0A8B8K6X8_ABRPR|nr:uncharacterized protein LOC113852721 [Abrus precatorius]
MPFPWKKNRVTRISQIVADLQSPKRGASLVVQTGFPTSLIDLFVKNRSRFKKHRSKKPLHHDIPDPPPPSPATTPPPSLSLSEIPLPTPELEPNADEAAVSGRVGECGSGSGFNLVIVKILMVVVLLSTVKRVTVGITVSAFALLFLEYAMKRVVLSSNLKFFFQRVSDCVWFRKLLLLGLRLKQKKEVFEVGEGELSYDSLCINEIEVVEAKSEVGVCGEWDSLSGGVAWGSSRMLEDDESSCHYEASECKIKGSRSGRFKAKMVKKLVPKKFRGSKKEKKEKGVSKQNEGESCSEVSSVVEEDKLPILEIEEEVEEDVGKEAKVGCMKDDEVDGGITCSHEKRVNRVGNSGSIILVIIALAGLLVGRFQALLLSMAWCCLQKMVTSLWRSHNVPLIKGCSIPNS